MEIIYRSKDYAVIYKPYGMLSEKHPTGENVPDALAEELGVSADKILTVHRLDRTTEGLMVYALSKKGASELSRAIQNGSFKKTYTAYITADENLAPEGEMRDFMFFDRRRDKSFVVNKAKGSAKEALLTYRLGETFEYKNIPVTTAQIELGTGRTHQIRVQFASRKSPLVGDGKYGSRVNYKGPALFSSRIEFPWNGKTVSYSAEHTFG